MELGHRQREWIDALKSGGYDHHKAKLWHPRFDGRGDFVGFSYCACGVAVMLEKGPPLPGELSWGYGFVTTMLDTFRVREVSLERIYDLNRKGFDAVVEAIERQPESFFEEPA